MKINELETLAKNGDAGALYELGQMYFKGIGGVEVNYNKAREYFEVAAESGSKGANYYLGKIYYNGNGVQINHLKAKEYFEKSSSYENVFSKYYLGKLYYWGDGVEKDYNKANELKNLILKKPIYASQEASLQDFYSLTDFEETTKKYVDKLQQQVNIEYRNLFGNE